MQCNPRAGRSGAVMSTPCGLSYLGFSGVGSPDGLMVGSADGRADGPGPEVPTVRRLVQSSTNAARWMSDAICAQARPSKPPWSRWRSGGGPVEGGRPGRRRPRACEHVGVREWTPERQGQPALDALRKALVVPSCSSVPESRTMAPLPSSRCISRTVSASSSSG